MFMYQDILLSFAREYFLYELAASWLSELVVNLFPALLALGLVVLIPAFFSRFINANSLLLSNARSFPFYKATKSAPLHSLSTV